MAKQANIELDGIIKQALSNAMFRVELENEPLISLDALLVKVNERILNGLIPFFIKWAILYVKTLVFPDPAPAMTIIGPSICSTACFCSGFKLFK